MKNLIILSKDRNSISYADKEVKALTRDEAIKFLSENPKISIETLEKNVSLAEDNLTAIINEIDTKVAGREAELEKKIKEDLEKAKLDRKQAIEAAEEAYDLRVKELTDEANATAEAICKFKEEGLCRANESLDEARKELSDAKAKLEEFNHMEEICKEALEVMDSCVVQTAPVAPTVAEPVKVVQVAPTAHSSRLKF